jgi:hypothetical protein
MKLFGISVLLVVGVASAFMLMLPSVTIRYRLTLEALVDGQPRAGSGVVQVGYYKKPKLLPNEAEFSVNVRGQALQLDLGKPGILFALFREDRDVRSAPEWIVLRAFGVGEGGLPRPVDDGIKQIRKLSGKVDLPLTSLPLLVRFRDLNAPTTVERVNPLDLEPSFGAGVKLVRATLEIVPAGIWPLSVFGITGEPVTTGIERHLPWINKIKSNIDGTSVTMSRVLPNTLEVGNFRRE